MKHSPSRLHVRHNRDCDLRASTHKFQKARIQNLRPDPGASRLPSVARICRREACTCNEFLFGSQPADGECLCRFATHCHKPSCTQYIAYQSSPKTSLRLLCNAKNQRCYNHQTQICPALLMDVVMKHDIWGTRRKPLNRTILLMKA